MFCLIRNVAQRSWIAPGWFECFLSHSALQTKSFPSALMRARDIFKKMEAVQFEVQARRRSSRTVSANEWRTEYNSKND